MRVRQWWVDLSPMTQVYLTVTFYTVCLLVIWGS